MEAVGKIRAELKNVRKELKAFDLAKSFPNDFDPLNDTLPANIDAKFDEAIAAAKANNEEALLDACHAIEDYFNFPKPNLIVKTAEVPGGMYSNMVAQLKSLGAEDVLNVLVARDVLHIGILGTQSASFRAMQKIATADSSIVTHSILHSVHVCITILTCLARHLNALEQFFRNIIDNQRTAFNHLDKLLDSCRITRLQSHASSLTQKPLQLLWGCQTKVFTILCACVIGVRNRIPQLLNCIFHQSVSFFQLRSELCVKSSKLFRAYSCTIDFKPRECFGGTNQSTIHFVRTLFLDSVEQGQQSTGSNTVTLHVRN